MSTQFLTLSMKNLASIKCPIFDADVQVRSCVLIRDKVYSGKRLETRRGCQACISASKCPVAELVRRVAFGTGDATDHCSATEEKAVRLPGDVLDKIRPIMVQHVTMESYMVPSSERLMIESASIRIEAQLVGAPREVAPSRMSRSAQPPAPAKRSKITNGDAGASSTQQSPSREVASAAATGDLSVAISRGVK